MSTETSIRVNFSRPLPLFPLDRVHLLPQQLVPLHIFEPRYRQMVQHALDGSGQIAMAIFADTNWKESYTGRPPLKPAVCVGQIAQHERLPDGRYNILIQGVCRASIADELPASSDRLYRAAILQPLGLDEADAAELSSIRSRLSETLSRTPLTRLNVAKPILDCTSNDAIPTEAILELIAFTVISTEPMKYALLSEGNPLRRAELILRELGSLERLINLAERQRSEIWPKGCSWN